MYISKFLNLSITERQAVREIEFDQPPAFLNREQFEKFKRLCLVGSYNEFNEEERFFWVSKFSHLRSSEQFKVEFDKSLSFWGDIFEAVHTQTFTYLNALNPEDIRQLHTSYISLNDLNPEEFNQFCSAIESGRLTTLSLYNSLEDCSGLDELDEDKFMQFCTAIATSKTLNTLNFSSCGFLMLKDSRFIKLCKVIDACENLKTFYFASSGNMREQYSVACFKALARAVGKCSDIDSSGQVRKLILEASKYVPKEKRYSKDIFFLKSSDISDTEDTDAVVVNAKAFSSAHSNNDSKALHSDVRIRSGNRYNFHGEHTHGAEETRLESCSERPSKKIKPQPITFVLPRL